MTKKINYKLFALIISALIIISVMISTLFSSDNVIYVNSEIDNSSDAGVIDIKDDFRFNGLSKGKTGVSLTSYENVATGEYGSYTYGLIPAESFGSSVDAKTGYIIYSIDVEGNGLFFLVRTLSLKLEYLFKDGNNSKINVAYAPDDYAGGFIDLTDITPDNYNVLSDKEIDLTDIINAQNLTVQTILIKITLVHDESLLSLDDVSINLFSVNFKGMHNFVMKKGASIKQSASTTKDLFFRAFIAKDCYEQITARYNANNYTIKIGNIIMPFDYIDKYDAKLEKNNIIIDKKGSVYVGKYKEKVTSTIIKFLNGSDAKTPYVITVNNVDYYYFDSAINNIRNANIGRDFISRAYIYIESNTSSSDKFLSLAAYNNQNIENNSRSAYYLGQKVLETTPELSNKIEKVIFTRVAVKYLKTYYTVRKFYIDYNFNIVKVTEQLIDNVDLNSTVDLVDKEICDEGYAYIGDDGVIKDGEKELYRNSFYDKVYCSGKLVIDLFYTKV